MARISKNDEQIISDHMDKFEPQGFTEAWERIRANHIKEARPAVRPKLAVQQRKVSTVRECYTCDKFSTCNFASNRGACAQWKLRTAKTVA